MIYLRYDLRWKDYETLKSLDKGTKSEFEVKYDYSNLSNWNNQFYAEFQREKEYVISISNVTTCELIAYVAVGIEALDECRYEKRLQEAFQDCSLTKKKEVTLEEFRREVKDSDYGACGRRIMEKLKIDFSYSLFNPLPFRLEEDILPKNKLSKTACKKRAKEILASKSFYEEIERIYSKENLKEYMGQPVHYMISAGDWGAARDMYELLLAALISNKRLISNRVEILRNIEKNVYRDSEKRFQQIVGAAEGGAVIIELQSGDDMGQFASDFHEITKMMGTILEKQKKDTLFVFVEIMGKSLREGDAVNQILTKADVIQITEGSGTLQEAQKYLMELVDKVDFHTEDKSDAVEFLPKAESYSVTDIFNAYNAWYGSGLKNHVYKAYKEKKSFQVTVTKKENRPYEKLQEMIGLAQIKTVVDEIIAASKVRRARERMGLNIESSSLHMMFSGNPGTAKTTVARLLAKILKEEDAIDSGKFVECGRQDLVGRYVGWTAPTVEAKFREAMGGILFIDEAYALVDDGNTYGAEAINAITQMMENYRKDVIVIFAGYPNKMQKFLEQNEGLKSRIAFHLNFPDYTADELTDILSLMSREKDYQMEEEALDTCREIFSQAVQTENFGNGRYARNVLEQAILRQSNRIIQGAEGRKISKEELCLLKKEDFREVIQEKREETKKIGFVY